ncbi:MAG: hypothetical protein E7425_00235, partial [Ruminococcaceae bacterium]|nr:hypothetical protein [Oscillospiraceae bacterium]
MDARDEEKRLVLENKKLAREIKRLNQDISLLRAANEQAARTQAYIRKETDRQMFYIEQLTKTSPNVFLLTDERLRTVITSDLYFQYNDAYDKQAIQRGIPLRDALSGMFPAGELDIFMSNCLAVLGGESVKPFILSGTHADGRQSWRTAISPMSRGEAVV